MGPKRTDADGLHSELREKKLWPHHRDLFRPGARHALGWRQQPRRGLRDRVVTFKLCDGCPRDQRKNVASPGEGGATVIDVREGVCYVEFDLADTTSQTS